MLFYHIWTLPILTNIYVAKTKQRMADTHLSIETTCIAYPICYMMLPNMPFRKADAHPLRLNTRCKDLTLVPSIDQKADNKNGGKDITFFSLHVIQAPSAILPGSFCSAQFQGRCAQTRSRQVAPGGSLAHRLLTQGHRFFWGVTVVRTEKCPTIPGAQIWNLRPQGAMPLWATLLP